MLRWLPVIVQLALLVYCLVDCVQADERRIRILPRWAWVLIIIILPIAGGLGWLLAGRPVPGDVDDAGIRSMGPLGPDDDPDFLNRIDEESERQRRLESWEDDLRRRETELKPDDQE
ncbi:MAG: PLD nuclease N-terminal domain-containing protein [Actinomycetales bacterium]